MKKKLTTKQKYHAFKAGQWDAPYCDNAGWTLQAWYLYIDQCNGWHKEAYETKP